MLNVQMFRFSMHPYEDPTPWHLQRHVVENKKRLRLKALDRVMDSRGGQDVLDDRGPCIFLRATPQIYPHTYTYIYIQYIKGSLALGPYGETHPSMGRPLLLGP